MIYGYARVSTKGQLENNSFENQEREILAKYDNAEVIKEQFTGTTTDRPVLKALIAKLEGNDLLVVSKLDRLARSVVEGIQLIQA